MKKLINRSFALLLCLCTMISTAMLTGCSEKKSEPAAVEQPTNFTIDQSTGKFSFNGVKNASYYYVWAVAVGDDGKEASNYSSGSQRLIGSGTVSGTLDLKTLSFGKYNIKLLTFVDNNSFKAPDPIVKPIVISGKLDKPEFKYVQDDTKVTVTLSSTSLNTYYSSQKLTDYTIKVYDSANKLVTSAVIAKKDINVQKWGPMTNFSGNTKDLTLNAGTYKISVTAEGDGSVAEKSDESEMLNLVVAAGAKTEGKTTNYPAQEGGFPGTSK